jgi:homoserine O-acetyltransferase
MDSGAALAPLTVAYQTYGALNAAKSNAILLCHALTGDQHVANPHPVDRAGGRPWSALANRSTPIAFS